MATDEPLDAVLTEARALGFLGPGPVDAHRAHAAAFAALLDDDAVTGIDLGSGGGVPGLVLAIALPKSRWRLVDAMGKRTVFLAESVARLGLGARVQVWAGRAEDLGRSHRAIADVVVARGFGPPPVTAECAAPFLRAGGQLIVSEPPGGAPNRWDAAGLAAVGLALERVAPGPPALAALRQASVCPDRYPRRSGVPAKRPLWS